MERTQEICDILKGMGIDPHLQIKGKNVSAALCITINSILPALQPTWEEIELRFPHSGGAGFENGHSRYGVYWCIDFKRDPAKEVSDESSGIVFCANCDKEHVKDDGFYITVWRHPRDTGEGTVFCGHACMNEFVSSGRGAFNPASQTTQPVSGEKKDRYLVVIVISRTTNIPGVYAFPTVIRDVYAENEIKAMESFRESDEFSNTNIISISAIKL